MNEVFSAIVGAFRAQVNSVGLNGRPASRLGAKIAELRQHLSGVSLFARGPPGRIQMTPLIPTDDAAVRNRQFEIVRLLVAKGATVDGRALRAAVAGKPVNIELIGFLIANGADVNSGPPEHASPLSAAINNSVNDCLPVIELLLKSGADVNGLAGLWNNARRAVRLFEPAGARERRQHSLLKASRSVWQGTKKWGPST